MRGAAVRLPGARHRLGAGGERTWPYDITRFALPPTQKCYADAALNKLPTAHSVPPNAAAMKQCLALGHPFVVGIAVFSSFETVQVATTGVVPMPQPAAGDQLLGGHAVLCVGYDDVRKRWIMRNSWGRSWGAAGYFYLDYLDPGLASDAWMLC